MVVNASLFFSPTTVVVQVEHSVGCVSLWQ